MTCPVCGEKTTVRDSLTDCEVVCRERKCTDCGHVFHTEECEVRKPDRFFELRSEKNRRYREKHAKT